MSLNSHSNLRIEVIFPKADLSSGQFSVIDWDLTEVAPTVDFFVAVVAASCDCSVG